MKPFSALTPAVSLTLILTLVLFLVLAVSLPGEVLVALVLMAGLTLVGALFMAWEAASRRKHPVGAEFGPDRSTGLFVAFTIMFSLLAFMSAPGLTFKDAGELSTSVLTFGVAHPTGFAGFTMIGKLAGLLPFGSVFFRLNIMSAISMALAGVAGIWIVHRLVGSGASRIVIAIVTGGGLLVSETAWLHATTTEVYAISLLGTAVVVALFLTVTASNELRHFALGAFATGLGAGFHLTWLIYGGFAGMVALAVLVHRRRITWSVLAISFVLVLLGAAVTAYLPVAAGRDPLWNWGDPSTLDGWVAHLTGRRIRQSFADQVGVFNPTVALVHLREVLSILWRSNGLLWAPAVFGVAWLARRRPSAVLVIGGIAVGDIVYAVIVNPMGIRDLQTPVVVMWAIPVAAAIGAHAVFDLVRMPRRILGIAIVLVLMSVQFMMSGAARDVSNAHGAHDMAQTFMSRLPPGAVVFTTSDDFSATILAVEAVESARPDVLPLVRQFLGDSRAVNRRIAAHKGIVGGEALEREAALHPFEANGESPSDAFVRAATLALQRGPVFVEMGEGVLDGRIRGSVEPFFPVMRLIPGPVGLSWSLNRLFVESVIEMVPSCDRWGRAYLGSVIRVFGTWLAQSGDSAGAESALMAAMALDPDSAKAVYNLAVIKYDQGLVGESLALLRRAVANNGAYARAYRRLAIVAGEMGRVELAERSARIAESLGER